MSDIKQQVEECLRQAEEIEHAGVIKDKLNTTFRENLRYEFLKFLVYLSEGDGYIDEKEIAFINSSLGYKMTEAQMKSIRIYDKLCDDTYTKKVPFALKGFVLCDAGRKLGDDKKRANNLVNTFRVLGQEFIACNDVTSEQEVKLLTDYMTIMEKFLKEYGLYEYFIDSWCNSRGSCILAKAPMWRYVTQLPQGRNAARIRVRCRVRGGSLYMLLDLGRLKDMLLQCGSGHDS